MHGPIRVSRHSRCQHLKLRDTFLALAANDRNPPQVPISKPQGRMCCGGFLEKIKSVN